MQSIVANGLRKGYGGTVAVESLTLTVERGTVLGFLGPNGAGKTTAIRVLSTVLAPDAGTFSIAGVPHTDPSGIRRRVGVLPESAGYPAAQTGEEWLVYQGQLFGLRRPDALSVARQLLGEVGLRSQGSTPIRSMSRGMRQRLGIARALVNDPEVVFLDEPTLGLDPAGQRQVLALVTRVAAERGVTVVLSSHLIGEVEQVCHRVVILNRGRVVSDGTVAETVSLADRLPERAVLEVRGQDLDLALDVLRANGIEAASAGGAGLREAFLTLTEGGS